MRFWKALIKATIGTVVPLQTDSAKNTPPPRKNERKLSVSPSYSATAQTNATFSKQDEIGSLTSKHLQEIRKIKNEYKKLVEEVKKELERIKVEKLKKSI